MHPYVGVSGITSRQEALDLLGSVPVGTGGRCLMIGVLASVRTLQGFESAWGRNRHPSVEEIAEILPDHQLVLNAVHFHSDGEEPLADSLRAVADIAGPRLHALQLNFDWPSPEALRDFRSSHPGMALILQIRGGPEDGPEATARRIAEQYDGVLDAILFDPSGGLGRSFDLAEAQSFLAAIEDANPGLGLGVAGGLSSETLPRIAPLLTRFPLLSLDAEARLRDGEDRLDLARAADYVRKAFEMLEQS